MNEPEEVGFGGKEVLVDRDIGSGAQVKKE